MIRRDEERLRSLVRRAENLQAAAVLTVLSADTAAPALAC